ncbi:hypothetical protein [Sulfurimonas sp. HSL3-7]|uniref:hypothetical protein n=1 Tax=Sulfonitrofixus jiaomeiensis TaxID=3131938 RepID=UPI0031F94EA5
MLFYPTLFLGLLYFKIFRVRRKLEKKAVGTTLEGFFANTALAVIVLFGSLSEPWYLLLTTVVGMNIMASLMVTAVQLGIFIDGKPLLGLSQLYKVMPLLAMVVISGSVGTVTINYLG